MLRSPNQYIHVSQKLLKGAAARALLFWLCGVLYKEATVTQTVHDLRLDCIWFQKRVPTRHRSNCFLAMTGLYAAMAKHGTRGYKFRVKILPRKFFPSDLVLEQIRRDYDMFRRSYN